MTGGRDVEVLLVEDNPHDAELTLRSLAHCRVGGKVHWARDGAEAFEFLFCEGPHASRDPGARPKLVLLDIRMPRVDGIEVLRRMKADERTRHIPVVIMTSSSEERDVIESYRLGVNSYIVKPVQFEAFAETVAQLGLYWVITNRTPE